MSPWHLSGHSGRLKHLLETLNIKTNNYVGKTESEKEVKIPVPFKLPGMADALEDNFGWIAPQNLFDENGQPKIKEKGDSQPCIGRIQCIYDKFASFDLGDDDDLDLKNT